MTTLVMRQLTVVAITLALAAAVTAPAYAIECDGATLPDGCLFTITGGDTADPNDGFAVTNADGVPMWDFVQAQSLQTTGYPISQRWIDGPFTLQAFQKVILQWDPGKQRVNWFNTLDALADKYPDVQLPKALINSDSPTTPIDPASTTSTIPSILETDLDRYVHKAILHITHAPAAFANLASKPWFPDHITDREKAWITALQLHGIYKSFQRSIDDYYIDNRTVSFPNNRDVDIWIIKENPIDPENTLLDRAENFIRISEEFFGIPFPSSHLIITIIGDYHHIPGTASGQYLVEYIYLRDNYLSALEHELAHYYFNNANASKWLKEISWVVEGGAEFLSAYVNHRTGRENIADVKSQALNRVQEHCMRDLGIPNLHHLNSLVFSTHLTPRKLRISIWQPVPFGDIRYHWRHGNGPSTQSDREP